MGVLRGVLHWLISREYGTMRAYPPQPRLIAIRIPHGNLDAFPWIPSTEVCEPPMCVLFDRFSMLHVTPLGDAFSYGTSKPHARFVAIAELTTILRLDVIAPGFFSKAMTLQGLSR
jgi:hypothetical protein